MPTKTTETTAPATVAKPEPTAADLKKLAQA